MKLRALMAGLCLIVVDERLRQQRAAERSRADRHAAAGSGTSATAAATAAATLGVSRILAFGDSMTEGTTSPTFTAFTLTPGLSVSYPFKLQTMVTARYTGAERRASSTPARRARTTVEGRDAARRRDVGSAGPSCCC